MVIRIPIEDWIDLHTFSPKEIPSLLEEYLLECQKKGFKEVRIIHGKGKGVQMNIVHSFLKKSPLVESFKLAPPDAGSWGATTAVLKEANERMKKILTVLVFITFSISIIVFPALADNKPPQKGEMLPVINLPIPKNPDEKNYLGLSGSRLFKIPQIKASAVIVEIFSMYCPFCQKDAPGVDELYRLIENNPDVKNKVKLIGIGAGNSPYEVEVFKKTYNVPFPLFPDKDFTIHKACGEVRTPYYMVVKINENGTHQIVHTQLGDYPGAEPFLEIVLKASGLK